MGVRVLFVLATLALLYGCGQVSSPAEKQEAQGSVEETQPKSAGIADQQEEKPADVEEAQPKTAAEGCLGEYRHFGSVQYSPAGQKIVFISVYYYDAGEASANATVAPGTKPSEADNEICVVNADGTGMVNLTNDSADEFYAAWSPDGTKIGFVRYFTSADVNIFVMKADGSNETKIRDSAYVRGLSWSPDGQEIAFGASNPNEQGGKIQTMRAEGSGTPRKLTADPAWQDSGTPTWSPDGKWIAFQSDRDTTRNSIGDAADIYVMQVGDTHQWRQLTDGAAHDSSPAWSPDGIEIAFNRTETGGNELGPTTIYKVNMDGSKETRLIQGGAPTWLPDGKHIAYIGQDGGIYKMDSDGSDQTLVVGNAP